MNKTTLFSALAAAAFLAGCETTQHNRGARGALGGDQSVFRPARVRTDAEPSARFQTPAPVVERPLEPVQPVAQPQPAAQPQPVAQWQPVAQPRPVAQPQRVATQPQPVVAQPQPVAQTPPPVVVPPAAPVVETYVVKSGDVAGRIANQHGMTLKEFCEANDLTIDQAGKIRVGQKVKVWSNQEPLKSGPAVRVAQPASSNDPNIHVVKAGETLGAISAMTGVPVATLMKNNNIDNPNLIREGRKLVLKAGAATTPAKTPTVAPVAPTVAPTGTKTGSAANPRKTDSQTKKTDSRTKKTEPQKNDAPPKPAEPPAPVAVPSPAPAAPLVPVVTPAREPQDASVPNDQVKVDGTTASLEDLLGGLSLSDAREQAEEKKSDGFTRYTVKEGENLYHLTARFKVPLAVLREKNNLPPSATKIPAGTVLLIPDTASVAP